MEKKRKREIKYRTLICSAAGAFFCGFGANWGSQLDRNGNVAVTDLYSWLIPFLTACVLTPVFYLVVEKLTGKRLLDYLREKCLDGIGFSREAATAAGLEEAVPKSDPPLCHHPVPMLAAGIPCGLSRLFCL